MPHDRTYATFALHQICAVQGWQGVWWDEAKHEHWTAPVYLLGLVTRTQRYSPTRNPVPDGEADVPDEEKREVLGLEYIDGAIEVCDLTPNYCGLLAPHMTLADFEAWGMCTHAAADAPQA